MGWMKLRAHVKELFATKMESLEASARDRKLSVLSNASMKSKWLKAFKSLKTTTGPSNGSNKDPEKKTREGFQVSNSPELIHQFQEYTYKKITPCDFCSQVLRGHTRQGLKCRLCKMNVHLDCQEKVTTRCQTKSRLLRRQKSTSEIETRIIPKMPEEEDYAVGWPNVEHRQQPTISETVRKRRLFGGVRSFTVFGGGRSQGRSISLPEKTIPYAAGTRPFGQPLMLSRVLPENGDVPSKQTSKSSNSGGGLSSLFKKH